MARRALKSRMHRRYRTFVRCQVGVDTPSITAENDDMSMATAPTDVMSDLVAVCAALAQRRPVDRSVALRIHERAEQVKEDLRRKGVTDVAVALVRESRDEE